VPAMINCPYCGKLTDPKLANCPHCGGPMQPKAPSSPRRAAAGHEQHCPSCGAVVHDGEIICVQCGTNLLTGQKIAEERKSAPARTRRRWPFFVGGAIVLVALGVLLWQLPELLKGPVAKARELARNGQDLAATNVLRQYLSSHNEDAAAQFLFGQLRWGKQDYGEAAQAFQEAHRLDPANEDAAWGAVLALRRQQGPAAVERQRTLLQQLLDHNPNSARAWYMLALLRAETGDLQGELDALDKAVALEPDDTRSKIQLGIAQARNGDFQNARQTLAGAVNAEGDSQMQLALAAIESLSGETEAAASRLAGIGGNVTNDAIRTRLALGHIISGEFAKGEEMLRDSTQEVRRENALAAFFHALCLQAMAKKAEAAAKYTRIVDLNVPQAAEAAMLAAALYLDLGDLARARQMIDAALELGRGAAGSGANPARLTAMTYTVNGRILMAENQPQEALVAFQRAVEADPQYPGAALETGLYHIQSGTVSQGLAELRRYIELVGGQEGTDVKEIELLVEQLQETEGTALPPSS